MRHRIVPGTLAAVLLTALLAGCGIADPDEQDPPAVFQGGFHPADPALMIEGDHGQPLQGELSREEVYAVEVYEDEVGLSPPVACATLIAV